jgi:hypothetical protein
LSAIPRDGPQRNDRRERRERLARERQERRAERARQATALEKGIGFASLILIVGALLLLLPLSGLIDRDEPGPGECVPSYSKCLDPEASDYDCEGEGNGPRYTTGPIVVTGEDPFGLDPDNDGFACV